MQVTPIVILIAVIVIVIIIVVILTTKKTESVVANDGVPYDVYTRFANNQDAANTLADLNRHNVGVMRHLKRKYFSMIMAKDKVGEKLTDPEMYTKNLLVRYNPEVLYEHAPDINSETSYTINKGQKIYYCIRSKHKDGNPIHMMSTLLFVSLHEISHVAANDYGHGDEFWNTFKWILNEAHEAGIYTPIDYRSNPVKYCGMDIDFNPYFDW
jgi:hypothetical protein